MVLDAGALIAFERNDAKLRRLVELALEHGRTLHVPGGVVAQVWRDGRAQVRLSRLLGSAIVAVQPLDVFEARAVGVVCRETGTSDVVDASVVLLARRHRTTVVTSDPEDIRALDASLHVVVC